MSKILGLLLCFSILSAQALDLDKYKERLRSHMANMLGEDTTNKILGKKPNESNIKLPNIPQVKIDATNTDVYKDGKRQVDLQGEEFNKLSEEEKKKYRVAFIQELYMATRMTEAKQEDIVKFLNVLEQGGTREGVYRSVVLDSVYAALESYEETPNKDLIDFSVNYGEKYLARRFSADSMKKLNLWSIKRVIVEKTLELIDVLANTPDDLYSWYAVLSEELSRKYPSVWQNKARQNTNINFHYQWVKSVPFQQIKSEVIIKLHKLMNSLNKESNP